MPAQLRYRKLVPLLALLAALASLLGSAAPAAADDVDNLTDAYKVANFATGRGTVQVAIDIPALLRDGADADTSDDLNEVIAYRAATRVQGLSDGILRVQVDTLYLGSSTGIIESTRVGPVANGTRTIRANSTSAGGNSWHGDQAGETFFCTVRARVRFSARLSNNALYRNTLLSNAFEVPATNDKTCV